MPPPSLTAITLVKNEEIHIARCLASLKTFAERVIVVDSFSTDRTLEVARAAGAEVFQHPFTNYASQFNWAIDSCQITSKWTMRIDADEYVDAELATNIVSRLDSLDEEITGVVVTRYIAFLGRVIRHGGVSPQQVLKIWRTGFGRIENRWMDEHTVLSKGATVSFDGALIDNNLKDISFWIEKHNRYAIREMIDLMNEDYEFFSEHNLVGSSEQARSKRKKKKHIYGRAPLLYRAIFLFIYRYIFRLGFLDGVEGFSFNILQTFWYRYLVDLKIIEARASIQSDGVEAFKKRLRDQYGFEI